MVRIKDRVENILKVSRAARNSDKDLLVIYMQKSGMELTPKQIEIFKRMPSMETIRRVRQSLQEKGQYLASEEVETARFNLYQKMKYKSPQDEVAEILENNPFK